MNRRDIELVQLALDALSLALTDNRHHWTNRQRRLYEQAIRILDAALPVPKDRDQASSRCQRLDMVAPSPARRPSTANAPLERSERSGDTLRGVVGGSDQEAKR